MSSAMPNINLAAKLAEVIEKSRLITGHAPLSEAEVFKAADAWAEVLAGFTPAEVERAYRSLVRERRDRAPLQPAELLSVLRGERKAEARPAKPEAAPTPEACAHCDGIGFQFVIRRAMNLEYTSVRPCVCAAVVGPRSTFPLEPPEWHRDAAGYWRHTPSMFGNSGEAA